MLCALSVAGVSRSVTLVVAYIMTVTGRGWVESLAAVRAARPCAGPNLGFLRQLEEFENTELTEVSFKLGSLRFHYIKLFQQQPFQAFLKFLYIY